MCKEIDSANGKFMVSYDDRKEIRDLYKDYNIQIIKTIYAGQQHNRVEKNELVIMNYQPAGAQSALF